MVDSEKSFFPIVRKHVFRECVGRLTNDFRSSDPNQSENVHSLPDVKEDMECECTMEPECEDGLALYERELNFYLKLILRS